MYLHEHLNEWKLENSNNWRNFFHYCIIIANHLFLTVLKSCQISSIRGGLILLIPYFYYSSPEKGNTSREVYFHGKNQETQNLCNWFTLIVLRFIFFKVFYTFKTVNLILSLLLHKNPYWQLHKANQVNHYTRILGTAMGLFQNMQN